MPLLTLKDVYGDEFLLRRSSIYRHIREQVLQLGYRFTYKAEDYFNWPLMHLPWMLSRKTIPYRRNLRALKSVSQRHGINLKSVLAVPIFLERNVLLHESSHCLAHETFRKVKALNLKNRGERFLFEAYFGEACASSSECLVAMQTSSRTRLPAELLLNSYLHPEQRVVRELKSLQKEIGLQALHELLIHFYFLVNIRVRKLGRTHLRVIEETIGIELDARHTKSAFAIFAYASELNPKFLEITNKLHFRLNGMTQDFFKTRDQLKKNASRLVATLQPHVRQFTLQLALKK
jgi:hypothetical protein